MTQKGEPEFQSHPAEGEAEDESPYLRRQQALSVRRKRLSRRVRWFLIGSLGLLVTGTVGGTLAYLAWNSPIFNLSSPQDVLVEGNRRVARGEVLSALGVSGSGLLRNGINMFRLSLDDKKRQLSSIPWVQSASLTRAFPHRLLVRLIERTPVASVRVGRRLELMDGDGVILEKPEGEVFDFPVLTGLDFSLSATERKTRLALYQEFEREVAEEAVRSGWLVSEVNLSDADDLKALLVEGQETIQVHFGDKDFAERFKSFLILLPELHRTIAKIDSVDLRYHNQVVVNPKGALGSDK